MKTSLRLFFILALMFCSANLCYAQRGIVIAGKILFEMSRASKRQNTELQKISRPTDITYTYGRVPDFKPIKPAPATQAPIIRKALGMTVILKDSTLIKNLPPTSEIEIPSFTEMMDSFSLELEKFRREQADRESGLQ